VGAVLRAGQSEGGSIRLRLARGSPLHTGLFCLYPAYVPSSADARKTPERVRGVDALFDAMSPGDGGGRRQSVDIYEVSIDHQFDG
jgi:hypothetical protein